jgi:hypothetical protein
VKIHTARWVELDFQVSRWEMEIDQWRSRILPEEQC